MVNFVDVTHLLNELSGVYLLYLDDILVYVGKSTHVPQRVMDHKRSRRLQFNRVMVHWCEVAELDKLEFQTIRSLQPTHNVRDAGPPLVKIDLSRFKR